MNKLPLAVLCLDTEGKPMVIENLKSLVPYIERHIGIIEQDVDELQKYEIQHER